ncbi:SMC-Scp complex subunit ScpB [Candidatus Parcubacteria bacterium]|nr:SMC-Scp complex subunit ScpB [Candidatus Parcubacteria bacterium]
MKIAVLAKFFEVSEDEVRTALEALGERLKSGAIRLILTDSEAVLATSPQLSETIEKLRKDDLKKDIGKAGAETLAIVLYRGPLSRVEIDRIRGVNSTFILRNLLIRGLVERRANPNDSRSFHYAITPELFAHLGVERREQLPEFEDIMNTLDTFESEQQSVEEGESDNVFATT